MRNLATTNTAERRVLADGYDLEPQLRTAERRYAEARNAADQARDEWRNLSAQGGAKPEHIQAARAKFEAVAARCNRLRNIIDELEERLDS